MCEIKTDFHALIKDKAWKKLREELINLDIPQIADAIEYNSELESAILFRFLTREQAKEVFQELSHDKQGEIIEGLANNAGKVADLMNDMDPDARTAFFEELPGKVAQRLMQLLSKENLKTTRELLGYPKESIGRLMTPEYVAVKSHFTVAETLEHIRRFGRDSETLNVLYVVDENWKLLDDIDIHEILLANPEDKIADLVNHKFVALSAYDDQEKAVKVFKDYDCVALPVIDTAGVLLGIVTVDDIFDIAEEESTEDFHRFGAMQDAVVNPVNASISFLYKKRIFWLTALVFMNVFSGAAIANFEKVIESTVALVFFLPLLIDSSGNAGAQSATLMIRAMAMGDVKRKDWMRLLSKEFVVSLLLGITMAVGVGLVASIRAPQIILVVCLTMVLTVMVGSIIGMLLPFIFTRLKLDPAAASAPLITSIADISGVLIYFSIAKFVLGL